MLYLKLKKSKAHLTVIFTTLFIPITASNLIASNAFHEEFQENPDNMKPGVMYRASYTFQTGLSEVDVPEDLGKVDEMRALIDRWKSKEPDSLQRVIIDLVIIENTDKSL